MRRRSRIFQLLLCVSLMLPAIAQAQPSAERYPNESWWIALKRNSQTQIFQQFPWGSGTTALGAARYYTSSFSVRALPEWQGSQAELQDEFEELRDARLYYHSNRPNMARRSTWLYPKDGCYARAAHAAHSFESGHRTRPGKVFVFGNLRLNLFFAPKHTVYWSYHVAAAFRVGDRAVILDPAVEPEHPISLETWLSRISSRITSVRVAACDTYAYVPGSICLGGSKRQEGNYVSHQKSFLPKEWNYLVSLRLNPDRLLGNDPPWIFSQTPMLEVQTEQD